MINLLGSNIFKTNVIFYKHKIINTTISSHINKNIASRKFTILVKYQTIESSIIAEFQTMQLCMGLSLYVRSILLRFGQVD